MPIASHTKKVAPSSYKVGTLTHTESLEFVFKRAADASRCVRELAQQLSHPDVAFSYGPAFTQIAVKPRRSGQGYKARFPGFNFSGFEGVKVVGLVTQLY